MRHISAVGEDSFAETALELLREGGVDLNQMKVAIGATGIAMIFVDGAGENVIAVLPGANATLGAADADRAVAALSASDIILVQQEIPQEATRRALELARASGARSVLNIAPFLPDTPEIAPLADIVVANETEFVLLTGRALEELDAAMDDWVLRTGRTIVVTLGPKGAQAASPAGRFTVSAHGVRPIDTVGAGDTFCGYFAASLGQGLDLERAMRRAAVAGSLACLNPGAQPAIPLAADVDPLI